jgi:hypothetical protein
MEDIKVSYEQEVQGRRLGKSPSKSDTKLLQMSKYTVGDAPAVYDFWSSRAPFPLRTFGNTQYGDCTKASQALLAMRMERIETRQTPSISDTEIINNYFAMTARLYGGGDTGAYEIDALNEWRRPDLTFRDIYKRPLTIDAYTRINQSNIQEVKNALYLAGAKGIKVCFSLPYAWATRNDMVWDIPAGQQPIGQYLPGSWGGHSMTAIARYDTEWLYLPSSWGYPDGKISWRAFAIYCDEAYLVIDSVDSWRKKQIGGQLVNINLTALVSDVNSVSDQKIKL